MAKIDILLPYWGDPDLFKKAVESVLAQTEQDWRLLIFDDCYPGTMAAEYVKALKDKRIVYHRHKQNIGITRNFIYALNAAESKYCVMMGCDDIMLPNFVERALSAIGKADFYQPGVEVIDGRGKLYMPLPDRIKKLLRPKRPGYYSGEDLAASLCHGNWLYFPSIVWNTNTIKKYGFDPNYKVLEDVILELSIVKEGGILFVDNETTFQYRRFATSVSSAEKNKGGVRFQEENQVYDRFAQEFKAMGWNRAARAAKLRWTSRLHHLLSRTL